MSAHRLRGAPLLLIDWNDANSAVAGGGRWVDLDDLDGRPVKVRSVGWLVHETRHAVTLVSTHHDGGDEGSRRRLDRPGEHDQGSGIITIPRGWITHRRTLR